MKNAIVCTLFILFILFGCKKDNSNTQNQQPQLSFFDSSSQYIRSHITTDDFAKLDLANYKLLRYHGQNIGIQIFEKNASPKKYLILKKQTENFSGNWIDMTQLTNSNIKSQSGIVQVVSLDKSSQTNLIVKNNEVVRIIKPNLREEKVSEYALPEIIVAMPSVDFFSLFWLFDQDPYYADFYLQGDSGGGGGGGGTGPSNNTANVVAAPTIIAPDKPIADVKSELKCFTNNPTSTYNISINVNEPYPNDRSVFNPTADFRVGHTFLTLQQHNADGSSIIRNVGLYPKNSVKPGNSIGPAIFGEDSNTPFDVSLNISVSGTNFNTVLNSLISQQGKNYDLNNFNCTNSAMDALISIGINLPSTKSNGVLFSGNDPGDLGEDIRNLNLDSFSADNGNPKLTRTVSNSNDQTAPSRSGGC